jgi:hypothetical protein
MPEEVVVGRERHIRRRLWKWGARKIFEKGESIKDGYWVQTQGWQKGHRILMECELIHVTPFGNHLHEGCSSISYPSDLIFDPMDFHEKTKMLFKRSVEQDA